MVGRVHEVVVENFKSYEGRVRIGPFRKFTCVIGPNGAGKSNLMDAISFVLGVNTRHLRGDRLQALIHRKEGEPAVGIQRTAAVELVYTNDSLGDAALGDLGATTVFRRVIQPAGEARFQVNGAAVSHMEYVRRLEGVNILSEARNFLVFQGDVEAAAHRRGRDLTTFFEQVSGSIAFREEYEQLATEKAQKEDLARCCFARRRNALGEQRRVAQQKEEAEGYQALVAEQRRLQVEFYLFRFHILFSRIEETLDLKVTSECERQELQAFVAARQKELQESEQRHSQARSASEAAEQALNSAQQNLELSHPESIQVSSQLGVLQDRLQELQLQAQRDSRRREQLEARAISLREKRAGMEAELRGLVEDARQPPPFTPAQREQFEQAQRVAEIRASASIAHVRGLESRLQVIVGDRTRIQHEEKQALGRQGALKQRLEDLVETEAEAHAVQERDTDAAVALAAQLEQLKRDGQAHSHEREQLQTEQRLILHEIQDITATERQIEHERRSGRVSADLVRLVPGVHGRILGLCLPSMRRFRVAVNVALGGYVDAIVTSTAESARQCVQHLKDRMLDPLTFLPLGNLRVAPPDVQLQEALRGRPRLRAALDCISVEEPFRRVFSFLLGDVVIADSLEEGRRFVFEELRAMGTGCRIVTLDGETISRDGNLSVSSEAARQGSTRFDFAALEATRVRMEDIDRRLCELQALDLPGRTSSAEGAVLQDEVQRLKAQARESVLALERCRAELRERHRELQESETAGTGLHAEAERLGSEEAQLREELRVAEDAFGNQVVECFAQLSTEMGVDDIRRIEHEWRRGRKEAQATEREVSKRLDAAGCELALLEQSLQERASRDTGQAVAACEKEVAALQAQRGRLAQDAEALRAELDGLGARLNESQGLERAAERSMMRNQAQLREERRRAAEADRRLATLEAELQALRGERVRLLRQSVLEDVELPLTDGSIVLEGTAAEAVAVEAAAAAGEEQMEASGPATDVTVDVSVLPEDKLTVKGGPAAQLLEENYRMELMRLAGELERLRPNLKAIEQLSQIAEEADRSERDAAGARRDIEDTEQRFETVRRARRDRFMSCFQRVQDEITVVYRRLTGDPDSGPLGLEGGSAYLDLEDLDDPFNGGVKFTVMPPMKRFCDIGLLSGGERTLAAMALLFAIQAYQQPPFLVLDEVDAHLDGANVQALARYLEQSECQTIVISLKDKLFSACEGLVGVSRDRHRQTSTTFTWDLTQFRAPRAGAAPAPTP